MGIGVQPVCCKRTLLAGLGLGSGWLAASGNPASAIFCGLVQLGYGMDRVRWIGTLNGSVGTILDNATNIGPTLAPGPVDYQRYDTIFWVPQVMQVLNRSTAPTAALDVELVNLIQTGKWAGRIFIIMDAYNPALSTPLEIAQLAIANQWKSLTQGMEIVNPPTLFGDIFGIPYFAPIQPNNYRDGIGALAPATQMGMQLGHEVTGGSGATVILKHSSIPPANGVTLWVAKRIGEIEFHFTTSRVLPIAGFYSTARNEAQNFLYNIFTMDRFD